jgi:dipeptidyl aminopeptidase/acylaminoacyl peptidase
MRVHYFDPAMQAIQATLEKTLPNQSVLIASKDSARDSYLVVAEAPRTPPTLYLYKPAAHQLMVLLEAYPGLQQSDLGEMKPYSYKARDGLDIHAYLTLPPGKDPHNLPTIIMPHGGPEARDMLRFDWLAQFLASRGYAVLQPNFRGSSGYGRNFVTAGDGEWANKVQFDVQDGVKKLITDGVADPKRTCIFGWSYGGYMSLAGATFSPDLYTCAAAFAGVYDLDRLLYSGSKFESEGTSVWERRMGASRSDTTKMNAQSPAKHADEVKAPVLLMHSDKDVTVPIEQSEFEEQALKKFGKTVQFVKMSGDDHQLSYAPTRIQMLTELEKFLAANIGH